MNRLIAFILSSLVLLLQGGGQPVSIPIPNSSFEQSLSPAHPSSDSCGNWAWGGVPGWDFGYNAGVFQPNNPNTCGIAVPAPDGANIAYAGYGGSFFLDTGVKASDLQAVSRDGIYTLSFWITNRFGPYPGQFEAELDLATVDPQTGLLSGSERASYSHVYSFWMDCVRRQGFPDVSAAMIWPT
jgi:hypothetical protein